MEFVKNLQSFPQSYNKSLINHACSGLYWEDIGPWSFLYRPLRARSVLSRPRANILPVRSSGLVNKIYISIHKLCMGSTPFLTFSSGIRSGLGIICSTMWRSFAVWGSFAGLHRTHRKSLGTRREPEQQTQPSYHARSTLVGGTISHHCVHHPCFPKQRCILGLQFIISHSSDKYY